MEFEDRPITPKRTYSCHNWVMRLSTMTLTPTSTAPAVITYLAPIRSMSVPARGEAMADTTDPTKRAPAKAPLPQPMLSVMGFKNMGNVLKTIPHSRKRIKKQAATM